MSKRNITDPAHFTFIGHSIAHPHSSRLTVESGAVSLTELLGDLLFFLRGCGFSIGAEQELVLTEQELYSTSAAFEPEQEDD